jgi:hypothetical protein
MAAARRNLPAGLTGAGRTYPVRQGKQIFSSERDLVTRSGHSSASASLTALKTVLLPFTDEMM